VADAVGQLTNVLLNGRYLITREIGRGGMATVYLARDQRDARDVAVKVLLPDVGMALGSQRFLREIAVASRFSHPRILPLYDSGEYDGQLYYVMPFVAGESLRARLDRGGPLSIDDAVLFAAEAADALEYAHEQGVVHRDIKPENILIDDGHALVVDFGIARAAAAAGEEKLTQTGITLGTPHYMSPEQGMADRNLDRRSDVYSLGCVLYEMLAGQPPFGGGSAHAVIARHAMGQVPSLTIVRPTVSPQLEAVVMRALAKVPADRFQTAHEFAEALRHPERELTQSRWTATTQVPTGVFGAPATERPRKKWLIGGAVAAAVVIGAAGAAGWHYLHGSPSAAAAGTDARKLAVMYFDDLSPGHSLGFVADGLTEGLIGQLSEVQNIEVISRGGVQPFKGANVTADSVGRALRVGTLVRGTVEQSGDKVHVDVRLVDATSGAAFDRSSFDQPVSKVLVLQDSMVSNVARMIRRRLGEEVRLRTTRDATQNPDAWVFVQRAEQRHEAGERSMAAGDTAGMLGAFQGADSLLEHAAALDANWAEPDVREAQIAYRTVRFFIDAPVRASAFIDTGIVHAVRALQRSPQDPYALEMRGTLRYWRHLLNLLPDATQDADTLRAAQADLESATRIDPADASAWAMVGHLYANQGDETGAKLAARRAYEEDAYLSNADVVLWRLFSTSYDLEQMPEAVHWCDVGVQRFPANPRFAECRLRLMGTPVVSGDVTRAWRLADSLSNLPPEGGRPFRQALAQALVAAPLARAGLKDSARHVLQRLSIPAAVDATRDISLDKAYAWTLVGDNGAAVQDLKVWISANPSAASSLGDNDNHDWRFRGLRDDPRFKALVQGGVSGGRPK
jgi:eukaryotic-like serine/threonine-protein kinase